MPKEYAQVGYEHYFRKAPPSPYPEGYKHHLINESNIEKLVDLLKEENSFSVDLETTGLDYEKDHLVGMSIAFEEKRGFYLPFRHVVDEECNLPWKWVGVIHELITEKVTYWFNLKFDAFFFEKEGLSMENIRYLDVKIPIWLTDTNLRMPSLKWAEEHFLGWSRPGYEDVTDSYGNFSYMSPKDPQTVMYAAADAISTYALARRVAPIIKKECPFILKLDNVLESIMFRLEQEKIPLDKDLILDLEEELKERIEELKNIIYEFFGYVFELNSDKQMGEALESKGMSTGVLTPKTKAMSIKIPLLLAMEEPIAKNIAEYRKIVNLMGSYVLPLKKEAVTKGFVRFSYKTTLAPTGRLAAGSEKKNPFFSPLNVQAIDKTDYVTRYAHKSEEPGNILGWVFTEEFSDLKVEIPDPKLNVRRTIKAEVNHYFVKLDYSGQELRLPANLSKEPVWVKTFQKGEDVHKNVAIEIWGADAYDHLRRKWVKPINFGAIYGATGYTIAKQLGITVEEGGEVLKRWWGALKKLKVWSDSLKRKAQRTGNSYTPFGRPRRLYHYFSQPNRKIRAFAYRTAVNTCIQGGGADLLKLALVKIYKQILILNRKWVKFRMTVHDELDFSVHKEHFYVVDDMIELMTFRRKDWPVVMEVGLEVGNNWGDLVEFKKVEGVWTPVQV